MGTGRRRRPRQHSQHRDAQADDGPADATKLEELRGTPATTNPGGDATRHFTSQDGTAGSLPSKMRGSSTVPRTERTPEGAVQGNPQSPTAVIWHRRGEPVLRGPRVGRSREGPGSAGDRRFIGWRRASRGALKPSCQSRIGGERWLCAQQRCRALSISPDPAQCGDHVAHAGQAQDADGEVPNCREHPGGVGRAKLVVVLVVDPVATQWILFSIPQWPRVCPRRSSAPAFLLPPLVMCYDVPADFSQFPSTADGSFGCAARGVTTTSSHRYNGKELIASWSTVASSALQIPTFDHRPGMRHRRRITPASASSFALSASRRIRLSLASPSKSGGSRTSIRTRKSITVCFRPSGPRQPTRTCPVLDGRSQLQDPVNVEPGSSHPADGRARLQVRPASDSRAVSSRRAGIAG